MTIATEETSTRTHQLVLQRSISASRANVFDAFVNATKLPKWWNPHGLGCELVVFEPSAGGRYHLKMSSPDGDVHQVAGEFLEVSKPSRIAMTWQWVGGDKPGAVTQVVFEFAEVGEATELTLTHSKFAAEDIRANHQKGWTSILDGLVAKIDGL